MRTRALLAAVAGLLFSACTTPQPSTDDASTPSDSQHDLDVPMSVTQNGKVPPDAVMNWQAFFKSPPSGKDRNILEQRLAAWTESSNPKELLAKGRSELALGKVGAAETTFRKLLRLSPRDLDAALELASLYLKKKDVVNAFEFLSTVKDGLSASDSIGHSFLVRYRYTLALAYIARGDQDKGHKVLSDLIGVDKAFSPAYVALATSYLASGKDSVAEFVVRRGLDRSKDDPRLLNLMGLVQQKKRLFDEARLWYDRALKSDEGFAPALVNRAALSAQNFELGPAETDLLKALERDPRNVDALISLGIVQKKQGNHAGAKASFTKAVDTDPDNPYARFNLAVLLADDLKKPDEAVRLFHEVLQTNQPAGDLKDLARSYINDLKPSGEPY
jgi:Tfp pilus assembly protein PilF